MTALPSSPGADSRRLHGSDNTRGRLWIACAIAAFLGLLFIVLLILENAEDQRHRERVRSDILSRLSVVRARIEGDLNSEILLTRSLVTEFAIRPDLTQERFGEIVNDFLLISKHLRNIAFSRGTIISYVYPLEANRAALGADYRNLLGQWPAVEKAILTQKTVVAGPVDLVQGGRGIISRSPVFVREPNASGTGRFIGLVSSVINIDTLIVQSGIEAEPSFMRCALRGKDGLGASGDMIHGDPSVFREAPLLLDIQLPNGTWQLGAVPANGWRMRSPNTLWLRLASGLIALVGIGIGINQRVLHERRREIERKRLEVERRIRLTVEAASVFWWEMDVESDTFLIDPLWYSKLLRQPPTATAQHQSAAFRELLHPDDYLVLRAAIDAHRRDRTDYFQSDVRLLRADGTWNWLLFKGRIVQMEDSERIRRLMGVCMDISERKSMEEEHARLIGELQTALSQVRTLSGLLPICARCKKIRDDSGYWNKIETYISRHAQVEFSHGICPECAKTLYPDYHKNDDA